VLAADGAGIDEHAKWKEEARAWTRDHAAWKEDRERAQAAIAKLQSLVTDHEKALAEHEVELAAHAREVEAHGAALTRLSPLLVLANAVLGAHVEHAAFHRSIMHLVREVETIEHTLTALGLWCDGLPIDADPETRR
jgi:chromosome segregation ATPase